MSNNNIRRKKARLLEFNNGKKKASNKLVNVIRDKVRDTTIQAIQNCSHFMRFHTDVTLEKGNLCKQIVAIIDFVRCVHIGKHVKTD